jgi:hypothetical protein
MVVAKSIAAIAAGLATQTRDAAGARAAHGLPINPHSETTFEDPHKDTEFMTEVGGHWTSICSRCTIS